VKRLYKVLVSARDDEDGFGHDSDKVGGIRCVSWSYRRSKVFQCEPCPRLNFIQEVDQFGVFEVCDPLYRKLTTEPPVKLNVVGRVSCAHGYMKLVQDLFSLRVYGSRMCTAPEHY
jgi:hypothetical protein